MNETVPQPASGQEYGIEETLDVIEFAVAFGNGMGEALRDGRFQAMDFTHLLPSLTKLPAALDNISEVRNELLDISPEERTELETRVRQKFDIPQDEVEAWVEDHVEWGLATWKLVRTHYLKTAA